MIVQVHIISKKAWKNIVALDPSLGSALAEWHKIVENSEWKSLVDVRKVYSHADYVDPYTVFNIKGNAYRLIVKIEYRWQLVFVKGVYTHAEYNRGNWKQ